MTDQPTSGNRWEPPSAGTTDDAVPQAAEEAASTPDAGRRPGRLTAVRTKLTAAAAVLFLGGGAAGFAVGHHGTDAGDGSTFPGQTRFDPDGDRGGHRQDVGEPADGAGTPPGEDRSGSGEGES